MESESVKQISECFIKPSHFPEDGKQTIHLTPSDLGLLSIHYIQKGLLFKKPPLLLSDAQESSSIQDFLDRLKHSLSVTLVHFYPLAGRLATKITQHPPSYVVYIDCINTPGAKFVHSKLNLSVSDILSPTYVPCIVEHFFDHYKAVNHDGHTLSLLTLKVTELTDGIFFGFSQNHSVADGSSFWKFVNTLSQVFQDEKIGSELDASNIISPPAYHERWFPDGYGPFYSLPFTHHDQFISRYEGPQLTGRIFHFSAAALGRIKAKANGLCKDRGITISTLQSLSALVWRCVIRVRGLQKDEISSCRTSVNMRSRLEPPLPPNYYGNCIQTVAAVTTAGELLENDLGWAAAQLTKAIAKHDDKAARETLMKWLQNPSIYQIKHLVNPGLVMFGSSPRFNMYGNEFGLGKAVGVLSGHDNKFDGKGTLYQGRQGGGGSIDVDLCLSSHSMSALERDEEFLDALHFSNQREKKKGSTSGIKSCEFSEWSREQNNIFEIGIAIYSEDLEDRWEKIAAHIPGKSVQDIKQHYKILLDDLDLIEFGYYDFCFNDRVLGSEEIGEKGGNDCVPLADFSLNDINELLGNEEIDEKGGNGCVPPSDYDFSFNGLTGVLGNEEINEKGGNGCVPMPDYDFSFNDLTKMLGNEEIGEKGGNGCVPLRDYDFSFNDLTGVLGNEEIGEKGGNGCNDFSSNGLTGPLGNEEIDKKGGNVRQFGVDGGKSSWAEQKGRKGVPWTEDEHRLFLQGLDKYGKGDWRSISRFCVVTRTPAQVASHAQKYYLRLSTANNKGKRRTSIHDITDGNTNGSSGKPSQQATPPSLAASSEVGQYDTMELPGSSWTNSFRYPS